MWIMCARALHKDGGAASAGRPEHGGLRGRFAGGRRNAAKWPMSMPSLESAEQELFRQAIELAHGNQAKAARWLGVSRITMKAKLVQFGFHPSQDQQGE